jgi:tetratricopeptide (TPR) repeat protein
LLTAAQGCVSGDGYFSPSSTSYREDAGSSLAGAGSANGELAIARQRIEAGEYASVLPRLHQITERYRGTPAATDARYYMGVVYYRINGYPDALKHFQEYLERAPEGPYAAPSRAYIEMLEQEVLARYATPEQHEARLAEARRKVSAAPGELAYQLALADSLWRTERYEESGEVYRGVLAQWPELQSDMTIQRRVAMQPDGSLRVLTPNAMLDQEAAESPLVIYNTNAFRSGREQLYARAYQDIYYNVSGQAVNRGDYPLHDVRVIVTIYGFANKVFDVQTVVIGSIPPGQTRAFSVRFSNFDDINNVHRYETLGTYTQ